MLLAEIGALNSLGPAAGGNRRSALWIVERAARPAGPLLEDGDPGQLVAESSPMPLAPMRPLERLAADFQGTGLTIGPHPDAFLSARAMNALGVTLAGRLHKLPHG